MGPVSWGREFCACAGAEGQFIVQDLKTSFYFKDGFLSAASAGQCATSMCACPTDHDPPAFLRGPKRTMPWLVRLRTQFSPTCHMMVDLNFERSGPGSVHWHAGPGISGTPQPEPESGRGFRRATRSHGPPASHGTESVSGSMLGLRPDCQCTHCPTLCDHVAGVLHSRGLSISPAARRAAASLPYTRARAARRRDKSSESAFIIGKPVIIRAIPSM
jgi:hypothetical protein